MEKLDKTQKFDFKAISKAICDNYAEHERDMKRLYVSSKIIPLSEFNEGLRKEIQEINAEITPTKDQPTIEEFAAFFKALEEYPPNLQKPKRVQAKDSVRSVGGAGGSHLKRSESTLSLCSFAQDSTCKSELSVLLAHLPPIRTATTTKTAPEIYADFKAFQVSLSEFRQKLDKQKIINDEYSTKLNQCIQFAHQLEQLVTANSPGKPREAFTLAEQKKFEMLYANLEDFIVIMDNSNVFGNYKVNYVNKARLEKFLEGLSYTLQCVERFDNPPTETSKDADLMGFDIFDD